MTIKHNYNYGYRYRMDTDAAANAELSARQMEIANIINQVFHVSVQTDGVARFISREDLCYTPTSSPTVAQVIAAIGEDEVADYHSTNNPNPFPNTHCSDPVCEDKNQTNTHHRSASAGLDYYRAYQNSSNAHKIILLTSGYEPCCVRDHDKDGVETHGYGTIAGLADPPKRVAGVYHADTGNTYKNTLVALHEISHCLGAFDGVADTEHGDCVMSHDRNNGRLMQFYSSTSVSTQRSLYCDACYAQIVEYLKYY